MEPTSGWDEFIHQHPEGKIYHLSCIHRVIRRSFGHRIFYLVARRNGSIVGGLPIVHMKSRLFGNFMVSLPFFNYGGLCADDPEVKRALLQQAIRIASAESVNYLELRHIEPQFQNLACKSHKVAMLLDLPQHPEMLWNGFKSKLRSQIRRPQKEGIQVKVAKYELLDDFYRVFSVNMRDLGTPVYSKNLFANMLKYCHKNAWIVVAYKDRTPLAAGFLLGYKGVMEIPWASSLRKYNRLAANMLMYWHALKFAIEQGYNKFDFGRSSPDSGTFRFKRQWGAEPVPLNWEYWLANGTAIPDMSPQNGRFQLAIRLWQKLPLSVTRIVGPSIVRNIP
ncbi:MAG: FemAB family PEP-CTERM system-associated protein [candidate division KSB1 bacterium]|nr:FemAB family PEP-CTERM system-associated protein [candidate division KSB1 bacterium]